MDEVHSEVSQESVTHPPTGGVYPLSEEATSEVEVDDETTRTYHSQSRHPTSCGCFDEVMGFGVCDPPCVICRNHYKMCGICERGLGPCCNRPIEIDGVLVPLCPTCHHDYRRSRRWRVILRALARIFFFLFVRIEEHNHGLPAQESQQVPNQGQHRIRQ